MVKVWYQNPNILLENLNIFIPNKTLSRIENINALARLAIYFFFFIIIFEIDSLWVLISIIIILISYFLGYVEENFAANYNQKPENSCLDKNINNPYMNYMIGDLINNEKTPGCIIDQTKTLIQDNYEKKEVLTHEDKWQNFVYQRNFFTMPNTNIVNDRNGLALWCYNNGTECKTLGNNCLKERDPRYHRGRLTTVDNGIYV